MRILQIDDNSKKDICKLKMYAKANRFDKFQLKLIMSGDLIPAGDNPDYVIHLHDGYRVVYSIEQQPIGWCRHISISVETKGKYPNEQAVENILKAFDITPLKDSVSVWVDRGTESINVLQTGRG